MDKFAFVIAIIAIVMSAGAFKNWTKMQTEKTRRDDSDDAEKTDLKAQVADLEERVRVLERLATDKSERLKEEIDAL